MHQFKVSLTIEDEVTIRQRPLTSTVEEKGKPRRNRGREEIILRKPIDMGVGTVTPVEKVRHKTNVELSQFSIVKLFLPSSCM